MNRSYEVEYCNLELRFNRRLIQNFIAKLIEEGYSLYWNENEHYFIISIRSGRKLLKLKFERVEECFKMAGNYSLRDRKLAELLEKMIGDARGHAIVKRFMDRQIFVENIMFGEMIRRVEILGVEHKVLFQKEPAITIETVVQAFKSKRAEERIPVLRFELDYELASLHDLLRGGAPKEIDACKQRLAELRLEWLQLEC